LEEPKQQQQQQQPCRPASNASNTSSSSVAANADGNIDDEIVFWLCWTARQRSVRVQRVL